MLVISRKENQSATMTINKEGLQTLLEETETTGEPAKIKITIVKLRTGTMRLGIDAPKCIRVLRDEIIDKTPKPEVVVTE